MERGIDPGLRGYEKVTTKKKEKEENSSSLMDANRKETTIRQWRERKENGS